MTKRIIALLLLGALAAAACRGPHRRRSRRRVSGVLSVGCAHKRCVLYSSGSLGARTPYLASTARKKLLKCDLREHFNK